MALISRGVNRSQAVCEFAHALGVAASTANGDCMVIIGSGISELEHDTLRQLKNARPRLLAIDEMHHLLGCTPREQRAALNVLKSLYNELRVSIVALGTSEALHVAGKEFSADLGSERNVSH